MHPLTDTQAICMLQIHEHGECPRWFAMDDEWEPLEKAGLVKMETVESWSPAEQAYFTHEVMKLTGLKHAGN